MQRLAGDHRSITMGVSDEVNPRKICTKIFMILWILLVIAVEVSFSNFHLCTFVGTLISLRMSSGNNLFICRGK